MHIRERERDRESTCAYETKVGDDFDYIQKTNDVYVVDN